ncbi:MULTISPECIES: thioredoxin-dependent thiol peroxidase [unclassified Colwellia]|uniref:thioredoxin-dependent thiol peroxidase n=1 Tax=unclassified Colwellia TaxID=196834 RepID=UPI0015F624FA|nr:MULTISPECIES: thioredoxin-dependent thiol peroxidase [unclassified Colwellia]MBA6225337.1 thioredoxin-dependent thiol peroxidase [Colwellia sp. MB3u-45]MBA6267213.1 thioredoxin-dependent thiol peroxidase [Colwellia sp. MB3u-43]MBA6289967.1 thioredoxin-dependent thiol peroxidase [Colwellia sp. MB3u-4]MBA6322825.1 thioredoxin-dependent thiol peroxidase [Colwellia sp. MB02u-19]MBA6324767.1 thioredoxin-dependent thiol peroxidase [Colwellia sp. MB02u-18]
MKTLIAGDNAPLFTLKDENDQDIKLAEYIGKKQVLVYFYPKAMTPGCTVQAQGLRDHKAELDKLNTQVFGISPDEPKKLAKFCLRDELNFSLLSDPDHSVADAFGVWGLKKFMGREYDGIHRLSFLIGLDGKISHVFNKFKTKDHHQVVLDLLNKL